MRGWHDTEATQSATMRVGMTTRRRKVRQKRCGAHGMKHPPIRWKERPNSGSAAPSATKSRTSTAPSATSFESKIWWVGFSCNLTKAWSGLHPSAARQLGSVSGRHVFRLPFPRASSLGICCLKRSTPILMQFVQNICRRVASSSMPPTTVSYLHIVEDTRLARLSVNCLISVSVQLTIE
jgi:hypothetical protein